MPASVDDWYLVSIRELLEDEFPGEWGLEPKGNEEDTQVLRSTDIDDEGHVNFDTSARRSVPATKLARKRLVTGDVLLEASGGGPGKPVGRVALFTQHDNTTYVCSNFFRTLRPAKSIDPRFLAWRLLHLYTAPQIWFFQQQTTGIINLKTVEYLNQKFLLPSLPEQRSIVDVLETANAAIQQTERLIAKLKLMRAGLLHDLLTRGMDEHGKLRDPVAHPEQFKQTSLGYLPMDWSANGLDAFVQPVDGIKPGPFGSSLTKSTYTTAGYRVYGQEQVIAGDLTFGNYYISENKYQELRAFAVCENDILMSLVGTTGKVLVVKSPFHPGVINPRLIRLRPQQDVIDVQYLRHLLTSPLIRSQLSRISQGGTMDVLSGIVLRRLALPQPTIQEQRRIAAIIDAHDARLRAEEAYRDKLQLLKQGLMDDLLTGRVRVSVAKEVALP